MAETRPFEAHVAAEVNPTAISGTKPGQSAGTAGLAGRQLGHFRVESLIAEGGMGAVYRGFDLSLSRPVAIKVIRSEFAADRRFLGIFLREAQAQANVVHSHVLQAYYVGEAEGTWFLAMQIVEGGSLEDLLAKGERLDWKEAARHMTAVVAGMAEAARLGIVHRDIKPANILIDRYGDAHVADFGLATSTGLLPAQLGDAALGIGSRKPGSTHPGTAMGTPEYMPPEQLAGQPLDERADVYAVGVSFYQMLAGRLPYEIHDLPSALAAAKGPPAPPLRKWRPEVPRAFAALIDRCIARSPADRPASFGELLAELRRVGPRPEVPPSAVTRVTSLLLDLSPFAALLYFTYARAPGLAFALLALWLGTGLAALSATPGQWMMRVWLRSENGGDVPLHRALGRSVLQLGWLLPGSLAFSFLYSANPFADTLGYVALAWGALSLFGALGALAGKRQTLYDRLSRTRVLVAIG